MTTGRNDSGQYPLISQLISYHVTDTPEAVRLFKSAGKALGGLVAHFGEAEPDSREALREACGDQLPHYRVACDLAIHVLGDEAIDGERMQRIAAKVPQQNEPPGQQGNSRKLVTELNRYVPADDAALVFRAVLHALTTLTRYFATQDVTERRLLSDGCGRNLRPVPYAIVDTEALLRPEQEWQQHLALNGIVTKVLGVKEQRATTKQDSEKTSL